MIGQAAEPCGPFKIGYSMNPVTRVDQLRRNVPFNLMLVAVIQGFLDEIEAASAEEVLLVQTRKMFPKGRGEWFDGDPLEAWVEVFRPVGGILLNRYMDVDLERAPLIPFPKGHWDGGGTHPGTSDAFHDYLKGRKRMLTK
jgi:hypothetical protein